MRIATFARVLTAVLGLAAVSACGKSPTEPFDGVKKLEVSGPTTAAPGQTLRYVATAHYVDGSTRDVTGDVTGGDRPACTFTSPGVATAKVNGEADVTATFHVFKVQRACPGARARDVQVDRNDQGTRRRHAAVRREDSRSCPASARASCPSGATYRFYGVAGPIRLEVSSTGLLHQRARHRCHRPRRPQL